MTNDQNFDLSIVILNFNVRDLLLKCLDSIFKNKKKEDKWQIIVVDNASSDGSVEAVKDEFPEVKLLVNKENLGFAAGNNVAIPKVQAPMILFLNPDTVILDRAIQKSLNALTSDPKIGAVGPKVELPDGTLDYSCHRGFPTPWNSFCYLTHLSSLFPKWELFSGYTASFLDTSRPHEVDCISGTFFMVKKEAGRQVSFWDEDYFFNGEDVEFCFRLKERGWKIVFYPEAKIIHYKGSSSGLWKTAKISVPKETRLKAAKAGTEAMRIFYMKHYYKKYSPVLRNLILLAINILEKYRFLKVSLGFGI